MLLLLKIFPFVQTSVENNTLRILKKWWQNSELSLSIAGARRIKIWDVTMILEILKQLIITRYIYLRYWNFPPSTSINIWLHNCLKDKHLFFRSIFVTLKCRKYWKKTKKQLRVLTVIFYALMSTRCVFVLNRWYSRTL